MKHKSNAQLCKEILNELSKHGINFRYLTHEDIINVALETELNRLKGKRMYSK